MPNITIRNLTAQTLSVPGGVYTSPLAPYGSATFSVRDTDEFLSIPSVANLIAAGHLGYEMDSTDALTRPLQSYTTATLPAASSTAANTVVYNSTERNLWICDGTSWSPMVDTGATQILAAATIPANRFVGLSTAGQLTLSPVSTERWLGVSTEAITVATTGRVQTFGQVEVMPAANTAANGELVAVAGGFAAPFQVSAVSLTAATAGADASDDIDQTNLGAGATVHVTCGGDETGNTLIVYGDVAGTATKETITLGAAGAYTSTNAFTEIYGLRTTAAAVGTIDIRDGGLVGLLIPQIAALAAARFYGAVVPGVSTASVGHVISIAAGGANVSNVMLYGTNFAGVEQFEVVTLNGATAVLGTLAFRALTFIGIGADGIAWNAGVTSQYTADVLADSRNDIRAYCLDTNTTAGTTSTVVLLPQNIGMVKGKAPIVFWTGRLSLTGGGATEDETIPGLLTGDIIQATILSITTPASLFLTAAFQAADTVRFTFSGAPGATVMHVTVYRP
jgi:hypothetical protein